MPRTKSNRRPSLPMLAGTAFTIAISSVNLSVAQDRGRARPDHGPLPVPPVQAEAVTGKAVAWIGDRLKVTFFERLDLPAVGTDPRQAAGAPLRTFYQRMDLSAEYSVDQDGVDVTAR